jgi:hypothetical protein
MNTKTAAICLSVVWTVSISVQANILTVTNTNDSGPGSLRQALVDANDGDTIDATDISGVITLTTGQLLVNKSVTINGPGANVLAVDGNAASVVFFIFRNAPGETVTISGLTIRNGRGGSFGGGIVNEETLTIANTTLIGNMAGELGGGIANSGTATITNTIISGNSAAQGGAIYNPGMMTVTNSTITGNMARATGGACTTADGTLAITNSTLSNNSADEGGAIDNGGGTITITNTTVTGNSATDGGGVYIPHGVTVTIVNSTLSNNTAARGGGAFIVGTLEVTNSTIIGNTSTGNTAGDGGGAGYNAGTLNIVGSTISGNIANREGAGIYNSEESTVTISNSTFSGNVASLTGGAIFNLATLQLADSTLSNNSATFLAGGILNFGPLQIGNTILNAGSSGVNLYVNGGGTVTSLDYNISSDDAGGFLTGPNDQLVTDPMLGPLQNNGGPTFTHALLPGSPAINSGDPDSSSRDQRYYLRSGRPDRGAFESNGTIAPLSSVSRKTHGTAGAFDVDLPLRGNVGIECRSGGSGGDHQLIMTFATPVTAASAIVTSGVGTVSNANLTGSQVTVNLTGVANAQLIVLALFGVSDGTNTNNVNIPMDVLLGDVNGNGTVNAADVSLTKSVIGRPISSSNFRADVNTSGDINATDTAIVKSRLGTALP